MGGLSTDEVFDFIDRSHKLQTVAELNRQFRELVEQWGFDGWGCIQVSTAPGAIKAPLMRIFGELNAEWIERYLEAGHISHDTAAHEVMRRTKPFWWTEITDGDTMTKRQKLVYNEAGDFGLNQGLAVPIRFPDGSIWSVMLYGRKVNERLPHLKELAFLASQYYAGRGLYLGERAAMPVPLASRLTERQREVVEWLRFGKTQSEIAKILDRSESTVNNLVVEAKDRLNAVTAAELVAEALLRGEIGGGERRLGDFAS
ncbi:MAG: LuxR family transcriptional regulator [Pseudomonadota bacterium]